MVTLVSFFSHHQLQLRFTLMILHWAAAALFLDLSFIDIVTFRWTVFLCPSSCLLITSCPFPDSLLVWWASPLVGFLDLWRGWCPGVFPLPTPCPPVPIHHRPPPPTNPPNMATPWESTWLSRRTAAAETATDWGWEGGLKKKKKKTSATYQFNHPTVRLTSAIWTYQQTACRAMSLFFLYETTRPKCRTVDVNTHTWAATLRWDWPSNSCAEDPNFSYLHILFLFLHWFKSTFCFSLYFQVYFRENPSYAWDTLTLQRTGRKSDLPALKEEPDRTVTLSFLLHFHSSLRTFTHLSANG